ncbi:DUF3574 domain-containing protein [Ramlibacter sp. G-1-2-2]|uniref:DUF3574 domain-containing protein n=1 Tax=Ramlibacter agri TaxID=2728837 RepID=A0A848H602_9BURK|nr:DUF3574 domain-containing protein [Ramlibacter agri]NML46396.1 DUF3574 domain-containing protein [Ramlibacter agri]
MRSYLFAAALLALLAGCAAPEPLRCSGTEQAEVEEHLYFGSKKPDGRVTDAQWQGFLADEVTPRFPEGLTAWPASGQWRSGSLVVHEKSWVLVLVHRPTPELEREVLALMDAYKGRFQQEAVLRVRTPACMSLH